jgi:hypothetical protein
MIWPEGTDMEAAKASSKKPGSHTRSGGSEAETLNFKVTAEFKREFKGYAVGRGVTMVDLLKEGFELSKRKHRAGPRAE